MIVTLRTIELLAILALAGFPPGWFLLAAADKTFETPSRLLLAPLTGLACLGVGSAIFYAVGIPVNSIVGPYWAFVFLGWMAVLIANGRALRRTVLSRQWRAPALLAVACVLSGLLVVATTYLWPFIQDGRLVFWHYAGSDGYMYMRIAEWVGNVGAGQNPSVRLYDAASGWVLEEMLHFHAGLFVDKPATMGVLAAAAAILGLLPHETFSPLNITSLLLVYLSLVVFARWLHLPYVPAALLGAFGAMGSVAWLMGTYTFLGNNLALPFFPLLLPLGRPLSVAAGAYAGVLLAALTLIFPDGMMVVVGLLIPYVAFSIVQALRKGAFGRLTLRLGVGGLVWMLPMLAFGRVLVATLLGRLGEVLAGGATPFDPNAAPSTGRFAFHPLESMNWLWPAFNLNALPPEPLQSHQRPFLIALAVACLIYFICSVWTRRPDPVSFGLISLAGLLAIGIVGGVFRSDYELFRALAVLYFLPLAVVFLLPPRIGSLFGNPRVRLAATVLVAVAGAPMLVRFAANDHYQFDLVYSSHLPDAQYTADDAQARQDVHNLLGSQPVVLSSETPSFTALANVLMLFSSTQLGVPNAYYKFVFFTGLGGVTDTGAPLLPRNEQYKSNFVLRNDRYADIFDPTKTHQPLYSSDDFSLFANDLIPFFDNDTFPVQNAFPLAFIKQHDLGVARILSQRTNVPFFSKVDRDLDVQLTLDGASVPGSIDVQLDDGAIQSVPVAPGGRLIISGLPCGVGLHTLSLGPVAGSPLATSFQMVGRS